MAKDKRNSAFREGRTGAPEAAAACRMPSAEILPRRTLYLALLFLSCVPYRGVLDNWLFNDDFSWLRAARYDMTPGNLLTFQVVEFFRPLVNLSFYIMEKTSPGNISLHYALNLALHFLCTLLVFHLLSNLLKDTWLAAASAGLFALTSVHSAAVLWISARTTLLSTFFLLASLTMLTSQAETRLRIVVSTALYILALASKEEAIAGVFLVGFLYVLGRKMARPPRSMPGNPLHPAACAAFAAASVLYLVLRHAFMGAFFRENWTPGLHTVRNTAGGFLYQLYPWPICSLFYPRGTYLPETARAFSPEILAVPLILLLLWVGSAAKRTYAMSLGVGWALLSLLPASSFRHRFFSTVSISQDRYYYLSSVGATLLLVLLLSMLWTAKSRLRQFAAAGIFILLCAGSVLRDARLERKWDAITRMYREVVTAISEESGTYSGTTTLAVEGAPLAFPYLDDAIALEMPGWKAVEVKGGKAEAERLAPCVYVSYTGVKPKLMRMEKIGRASGSTGAADGGSTSPAPAEAGGS